jgi:two-component system nitrate/nitrite response regulator NarL
MKDRNRLTAREKEILKEVAKGKPNKLIAYYLGIKENTLETHMKTIHLKTTTHSKSELIVWAADNPGELI